eukprot:1683816-Pleurochrysis_carterae.AAC.1
MALRRVGLSSRGHLEGGVAAEGDRPGACGRPFCASQRRNSGRVSCRKCCGVWCALLALLMDQAARPAASRVGRRGPPPSVVRRQRCGSSLRGVAPWPLQ